VCSAAVLLPQAGAINLFAAPVHLCTCAPVHLTPLFL
jgi:hypothetical protein